MTHASQLHHIETDNHFPSHHSQCGASPAQHQDLLQDCEWERRMRQLNPAWNPSTNEVDV